MIESQPIVAAPHLKRIGNSIQHLQSVTSTNLVLGKMIENQALSPIAEGFVLVADEQTAGRGQGNRVWVSPRGKGLWFSVFLKPEISAEQIYLVTWIGAVAVAEVVKQKYNLKVMIKWPNDVHVDGRKFCGILTQSSLHGKNVESVILGIGINLNQQEKEINQSYGPIASSLQIILKRQIDAKQIFSALLSELDQQYELLVIGNGGSIIKKWKEFATFLGQRVTIVQDKSAYEGIAEDIDNRGGLILTLNNGTKKTFYSGDLFFNSGNKNG